ncbi:peptide chain release factor N(5)-glutamine methyltransferase [Paenibacillus cisolokensis]|uniref:peptide chain release factor N(5)-glutamine methyltransferase n=1 Tax=Paenibacillus TaxID=44249 RepID=UPI000723008D|nr:peptide chain release factor N(5)-glutamine methyltransferase [Paenibacillus sp. 32O-W]ALS25974.1 SAM-dependent methyltransferase [Paenibacillus sp. 32O-W]
MSQFRTAPGTTIGEACMQASSFLASCGVEEARANAERLLMHLLGATRAELLRDWREPFPQEEAARWERLVARKAAGEPVQYIAGEQWFYGLAFTVTPAVLIPRPETELLVEAVLEAADACWPPAQAARPGDAPGGAAIVPTVADVGTGSGAIAVTLAVQRPRWRVCASDLSADALAVARTNAERHNVASRIAFVQGDLLAPFVGREGTRRARGDERPPAAGLGIDVLVSNPPYIPSGDLPGLQREVRDYEPRLALDGGDDGLTPYRRMIGMLPQLARIPRIVAFELGLGQAPEVAGMLRRFGAWDEIRIVRDYAGIERHVLAVRHSDDGS